MAERLPPKEVFVEPASLASAGAAKQAESRPKGPAGPEGAGRARDSGGARARFYAESFRVRG